MLVRYPCNPTLGCRGKALEVNPADTADPPRPPRYPLGLHDAPPSHIHLHERTAKRAQLKRGSGNLPESYGQHLALTVVG